MKVKCWLLTFLAALALAGPARASDWLSMCAMGNGAPVQIKDAQTGNQLVPLKPGDLVYQMESETISNNKPATLAFRGSKLTSIVPNMEELQQRHLVDCGDEPKSVDYPVILLDTASQAQLMYDNFGFVPDFWLDKVKLGEYSHCPGPTAELLVAGHKIRELKSQGVPLARFCVAMQNNSWFWYDPETGKRRPDFEISPKEGSLMMVEYFFKPIACFLAAGTQIDLKVREIRPQRCVFRFNPLTGTPISEEEGRAVARLAVFAFGPGEKGGTLDDTEGLSKQSARRLSVIRIKTIKGE